MENTNKKAIVTATKEDFVLLFKAGITGIATGLYSAHVGLNKVRENSALVRQIEKEPLKAMLTVEGMDALYVYLGTYFKNFVLDDITIDKLNDEQTAWLGAKLISVKAAAPHADEEYVKTYCLGMTIKHFQLRA